jgi:hypothetical protein
MKSESIKLGVNPEAILRLKAFSFGITTIALDLMSKDLSLN